MDNYAIELLHITKVFPGIVANDDITLRVRYGEIHALLGENGAGKSTLMSVLFGLYQPEEGEILVNGKKAEIKNPRTANALGIGMVHQHFMLVQNFTVLENIVLGVETAKHGVLQMEEARKKVLALSERYGLNIDCDARVSDITVGMQQRVEILKMLYKDNNILIFDEPTAVLTPQEIDELMIIMQNLKREGKAIIFITHKLNEIKAVSDYCTVLRRGKCIGTCDVSTASVEDLSEMMVGRKIDFHLEDSIGRTWQCGTIQLDFQLPQRFELEYIGADGEKHRPIMIHRVCFGSIERFIGILIEHFAGAFPTWLAPVQVKVLPISEKYEEYAKSVKAALDAADIRAEIDLRSEKIGYKIREAQGQKIPYMLVVGQKEQADGTVSVRSRFKGDEGAEDLNVFIANIKAEIAGRVNRPVEVKKEEEK